MPAVLIEAGFINDDEDNRIFDENFNKIAQAIADGILKTLYAQDINFNEIPDYVQNMPEPEAFNGTYQGDAQDTTLPPSPATRPGMNVPYRIQWKTMIPKNSTVSRSALSAINPMQNVCSTRF